MNRHLKRICVGALRSLGLVLFALRVYPALIWLNRKRVRILAYHSCDTEEETTLCGLVGNTTPETLRAHLDFLARHYRIAPLAAIERHEATDRAVVITFDDGYDSIYRNAFPILREYRAPAVVYLVTATIDNQSLVWILELNWFLRTFPEQTIGLAERHLGLSGSSSLEHILKHAERRFDPTTVHALLADLRRKLGVDGASLAGKLRLYLTWEQVRQMHESDIEFGNHTATHPPLGQLTPPAREFEIATAHRTMVQHLGDCTSFAYPFGDCDEFSRQLLVQMGYSSIMEIGGGNERPVLDRVGRIPATAVTPAELFAEMEVVAPLISWGKHMRDRLRQRRTQRAATASAGRPR